MRTRLSFPAVVLVAVRLALAPSLLHAQSTDVPLVSIGAAIGINCPGTYDGVPTLDLNCAERREGAPGPYVRPYVSLRPADRLLITTTAGYLTMPGGQTQVYNDGIRPPVLLVVQARTAWHVHTTAAYVGGEPTHPMRAFVGGGLLYVRDPVRREVRGTPPDWVRGVSPVKRSAVDGVFTTGMLFRLSNQVGGRVSYLLAGQLATPLVSNGGWRHEITFGLEWGVPRRERR